MTFGSQRVLIVCSVLVMFILLLRANIAAPVRAQDGKEQPVGWEYKVVQLRNAGEDDFNRLGANGWQLRTAAVNPSELDGQAPIVTYVFIRPAEQR